MFILFAFPIIGSTFYLHLTELNLASEPFVILLTHLSKFAGSSSEDDDISPRENIQKNSKGFSDFCVRRIAQVTNYLYYDKSAY